MKAVQFTLLFTLLSAVSLIITNPSKNDFANYICENKNIPGCRLATKSLIERQNLIFLSIYQNKGSDETSYIGILKMFIAL